MKRNRFLAVALALALAFLYVPIISMMVFSFNASPVSSVWGGFSLRWYKTLFRNEVIWKAALTSFQIAAASATIATILGTAAALAIVRVPRFRGRGLLGGLVVAPMVLPEIVTGIAMLLFYILLTRSIGWPGQRGFATVAIAHISFATAFVMIVVRGRLAEMDPALEEAAADLGSKPLAILNDITLPLLGPALLSGWLLAFTVSLDDVVITSFVTGPGTTTLPILIWSKLKLGVSPDINALASIVIVVVAIAVGTATLVSRRRMRDTSGAA